MKINYSNGEIGNRIEINEHNELRKEVGNEGI